MELRKWAGRIFPPKKNAPVTIEGDVIDRKQLVPLIDQAALDGFREVFYHFKIKSEKDIVGDERTIFDSCKNFLSALTADDEHINAALLAQRLEALNEQIKNDGLITSSTAQYIRGEGLKAIVNKLCAIQGFGEKLQDLLSPAFQERMRGGKTP